MESKMVGRYPYKGSVYIVSRVPCRAVNCYTHAFLNNGFEPNKGEMNEFKKEFKQWKSEESNEVFKFQFNEFFSKAQASRVKKRRKGVLEDVVDKVCVLKF